MIERAPPPRHGITRAAVIGSIAQLVERLAHIEEVGGSIPSGPTVFTCKEGSPIGRGHRLENGSWC